MKAGPLGPDSLLKIENLVLGARSEFSGFADSGAELFWSIGVLEYWSVAKTKALIYLELVFSLLHYSTTPSLQQAAARGKDYGSPLRGQCKAGSFESGFFTIVIKLLASDGDEHLVAGRVWTHPPHQNALSHCGLYPSIRPNNAQLQPMAGQQN